MRGDKAIESSKLLVEQNFPSQWIIQYMIVHVQNFKLESINKPPVQKQLLHINRLMLRGLQDGTFPVRKLLTKYASC